VTNPGDLPIRDVALVDDRGVVPVFFSCDAVYVTSLESC
jgi:hypothetical protein